MASPVREFDVAVIGAGSVGLAVAYYLVCNHGLSRVALIDPRAPMSLTSAQSGENYRNWWPHPVMTAFTDHSISLMEAIDRETSGRLNITRGGYALVTRRAEPDDLIADLERGYGPSTGRIRVRDRVGGGYAPPCRSPWQQAPDGVDVLVNTALIRQTFPAFARDVTMAIHIRRAGSFSSQQLGQFMLETVKASGGVLVNGEVQSIASGGGFTLDVNAQGVSMRVRAARVVNAAGPLVRRVAAMLGEDLPVKCVYQQKISFPDELGVVPRDMPFSIDLDSQTLAWSDADREVLAEDPSTRHLVEPIRGGIHCRPDGPVDGNRVKLGWAYNDSATDPLGEEPVDPQFPDTVLRGASRLHPRLAAYIGRLPRGAHHYGGYYTMTEENWPLIGPMRTPGAFMVAALSGFGSMAACAAGALSAAWVADAALPSYAAALSTARRSDASFMAELAQLGKGSL